MMSTCGYFWAANEEWKLGPFLVITLSYMVIYRASYTATNYLLISSAGVRTPHQIQPHFCLIPTKMPRNNFFVALGDAPAPLALPLATPMLRFAFSSRCMIFFYSVRVIFVFFCMSSSAPLGSVLWKIRVRLRSLGLDSVRFLSVDLTMM